MPQDQQQPHIPNVFKILGIEPTNDPDAVQEAIRGYKRKKEVKEARVAQERESGGGSGPNQQQREILENFKFVTGFESQLRGPDAEQKLRFYNNSLSGISEGSFSGGLGGGRPGFTGWDDLFRDFFAGMKMDPSSLEFSLEGSKRVVVDENNKFRPVPLAEVGLIKAMVQAYKNQGSKVVVPKISSDLRSNVKGDIYEVIYSEEGGFKVKVNPNHFSNNPIRDGNELIPSEQYFAEDQIGGKIVGEKNRKVFSSLVDSVAKPLNEGAEVVNKRSLNALAFIERATCLRGMQVAPNRQMTPNELRQEVNSISTEGLVPVEHQPPMEGQEGIPSIL